MDRRKAIANDNLEAPGIALPAGHSAPMSAVSTTLATPHLVDRPNGDWQMQLRQAFRRLPDLLAHLQLAPAQLPALRADAMHFPLLVPRAFAARMRPGDPHDPLLWQVLPLAAEARAGQGETLDPVGDKASERSLGMLQKYRGRALLLTTAACAIHCRYCFRQHYDYAASNAARGDWHEVVAAIASDSTIHEVILSGGDPLSLSTERLRRLTDQLRQIPHLRRLRIHTRWPVVLPDRVDRELLDWLGELPWPVTIVVHANHPAEIDAAVSSACQALRRSGAWLLNQSVLLAGVNDDADCLAALSDALQQAGVLPYYLHLLDPVAGAGRFRVGERRGRALIAELRARLPGYLVPRLAREKAGEAAKLVLA